MDSDSLDWIWGDFNNSPNLAELIEEVDGENHHTFIDSNNDDKSDTSSDSSLDNDDCSLLIGDKRKAQELNEIINGIKIQCDKRLPEVEFTTDDGLEDGNHITVDTFYIDALEAVKTDLLDVEMLWTDTLYQCTVNE